MPSNSIPGALDTILSAPDEWIALFVGIVLAGILIYVTEKPAGFVLGAVILFSSVLPFLPLDVVHEFHYWPVAPIVVFLLALYEWGPDNPL